jgi:hypothetical protein
MRRYGSDRLPIDLYSSREWLQRLLDRQESPPVSQMPHGKLPHRARYRLGRSNADYDEDWLQ